MKIRYYLRGLGLGILVTSIFFLVGDGSNKTMSDEQIKIRAKELGMIESTVLAEISTEDISKEEMTVSAESKAVVEENNAEVVMETETLTEEEAIVTTETEEESSVEDTTEEDVEEVSSEAVEESKAEEKTAEENSVEAEPAGTTANGEDISFVVHSGEGSDDVSRRLAQMGLITDAHEYDRYLMANGYDKKIRTGEHIIPAKATWEEMAKILCNQN